MHMPDLVAWIVSGVLALFGSWIIILNYAIVISWYLHRGHSSRTPLLGGLCLMAGMLASPLPGVTRYAWAPLVIVFGSLFTVVEFFYSVLWLQGLKRCGGRRLTSARN